MQEDPKIASRHQHTPQRFHALILIGVVVCVAILFVYSMRFNQEVSEVENRRLAQWPTFNKEALLEGQYAQDVEKYVADHFPGRAWLTEVAFMIRTYRGVQLNDRVIQVKGADTGFEDVSQWANTEVAPEITPEITSEAASEVISEVISEVDIEETTDTASAVTTEESAETRPAFTAQESVESLPEVRTEVTTDTTPEVKAQENTAMTPEVITNETVNTDDHASSPAVLASNHEALSNEPFIADENDHVGLVIKPPQVAAPIITKAPVVTNAPVISKAPPAIQKKSEPPKPSAAPPNRPLNVVGGVLLHEGQALFMFQGTDRGAQGYANAVNTWVELVAKKRPGMTTTVVVTPTSSHFYLPPAARARTTSEKKNLDALRDALLPEVRFADVIVEMQGHEDQPLFYKSDHHWTGLGAYYAYRAWAKAAGVIPLELSAFDKRSVPGVAGSFWSLTQAPELRHADKESFYYVPTTVTFDGTQYTGPQQKTPVPQPFFAEKSRGYIVFLGGDIPLLASNTNAGTGKTALVIKNSYGNAFAPYLLPHFDRVVVLDYRYVSRNIQDIVSSFGVTDLVFVNATITANSGAHQERMRQVARGSSTAWLTEAEKRRLKQIEETEKQQQQSMSQ